MIGLNFRKITVLMYWGCCKKLPQTWWLNRNLFSHSSGIQQSGISITGMKSRCQQGQDHSGSSRSVSCLIQLLLVTRILGFPWLVTAFVVAWTPPHSRFVCMSPNLCLLTQKTVIGVNAHFIQYDHLHLVICANTIFPNNVPCKDIQRLGLCIFCGDIVQLTTLERYMVRNSGLYKKGRDLKE